MKLSNSFKNTLLVIVALLGVGLMILFFYEKSVDEKVAQEENSSATQSQQAQQLEEISLPEPTGGTDVVWESALAGLEAEVKYDQQEDELAQDAINDENEVSDFSSAYEESEF